ncbi:hypothetical protein IHO94_11865, partial [Enterococcus faecium]|nr:hypothetical protein [Enterococcus faecium]
MARPVLDAMDMDTLTKGRYVQLLARGYSPNGTGQEHSFQIGDAVNYQGTIHIPTDIAGGADGIT